MPHLVSTLPLPRGPPSRASSLPRSPRRAQVSGTAERPRLAVFRSNQHIYAQVINDEKMHTIVGMGTVDKVLKGLSLHR